MAESFVSCQCKGKCDNRRCKCLKNGQPCSDACKCVNCENPLNGLDVKSMSACATGNAKRVSSLTIEEREALISLPCGHQSVALKLLIGEYNCAQCNGEAYFYSFCFESAQQDSCTWHCDVCRTCRDWREWHCPTCNRCTYGHSMPCDRCEGKSEIYDEW